MQRYHGLHLLVGVLYAHYHRTLTHVLRAQMVPDSGPVTTCNENPYVGLAEAWAHEHAIMGNVPRRAMRFFGMKSESHEV